VTQVTLDIPDELSAALTWKPTASASFRQLSFGAVGKTSVMAELAEWFDANQIPVKLLDPDTENKAADR
jgi:uncharacterized protein YdeI (YjbR/CyaY-like superfamily)